MYIYIYIYLYSVLQYESVTSVSLAKIHETYKLTIFLHIVWMSWIMILGKFL